MHKMNKGKLNFTVVERKVSNECQGDGDLDSLLKMYNFMLKFLNLIVLHIKEIAQSTSHTPL